MGGIRNQDTGEPWEKDTLVLVFSSTKGLSSMGVAVAHSQGLFDYDERVATYWPEFASEWQGERYCTPAVKPSGQGVRHR